MLFSVNIAGKSTFYSKLKENKMSNKLKPCPFCGSSDTRSHNLGDECNNCGSRVEFFDLCDMHGVNDRPNYNSRPIEDKLQSEIDKLNKALDLACDIVSNGCPESYQICKYPDESLSKADEIGCAQCWKEYYIKKAGE